MAITRNTIPITWSTAATLTLSDNNVHDSDAFAFSENAVSAAIQIVADNQGTPAAGDTVSFRIKFSTGDVWADTGDDYDTSEHSQAIKTLDTYATNTPGEDPAGATVDLNPLTVLAKLSVQAAQGATRSVKVAAAIEEVVG